MNLDYLEPVQAAVSQLRNCGATHVETMLLHKVFRGQAIWKGDVEVSDLQGHPKAKRAYAWSHLDGESEERTRFVAVLEIPPVESAEASVRVQIVQDFRKEIFKMTASIIDKMIVMLMGLVFVLFTNWQCRRGEFITKYGRTIRREDDPLAFWLMVIICFAIAIALLLAGFFFP